MSLLRYDSWELPAHGADHFLTEDVAECSASGLDGCTLADEEEQGLLVRRASSITGALVATPAAPIPEVRECPPAVALPAPPAPPPASFSFPAVSTFWSPLPAAPACLLPQARPAGLGPLLGTIAQATQAAAAAAWLSSAPAVMPVLQPHTMAGAPTATLRAIAEPCSSAEYSHAAYGVASPCRGSQLTEPHYPASVPLRRGSTGPALQPVDAATSSPSVAHPLLSASTATTTTALASEEADDGQSSPVGCVVAAGNAVAVAPAGVKRKRVSEPGAKHLHGVMKRHSGRVVCKNCGAQQTPQWRCGPEGPRTLCNACGVRYKKGLPLPYWEAKKRRLAA